MTYTVGGLIQAADYNGFANGSANNLGNIWGTGSGDKGWGQTAIANVSVGATVTATNWATLVANLATAGQQTASTLTSRTQPVAGNTIAILSNLATDIDTVTGARGNAAAVSSVSTTWTGSAAKTTATGSGVNAWTITWTQTVTFANATAARYFWNAGGLVRMDFSKSSTGTDSDADWNTFIGKIGQIYISGRVNSATQSIAGTNYTGTTRLNGTGGTQTTLATTTGWYSLTPGAAATTIFQLNDDVYHYTGDYVRVTAAVDAGASVLTLVTTWFSAAETPWGRSRDISGGSDTTSPFTSFGTAPCTLVRYYSPSTTYLANTWGTVSVASSVA